MLKIEKILFTTDFSDSARHALAHAVEIAKRFAAELTVLHVRTLFTDDPSNVEFQFLDEDKYEEFLEDSLKDAAQPISDSVAFRTAVERNVSPAAGVLDFCDEHSIDLIVMGTHGRSRLGHFFLGSVAEKVVRHAPCPVITVGPRKDGYVSNPSYKNVLAAFDFSEHSINAVKNGLVIARRFGARLKIFYALEQEVHPAFLAAWKESISHRMAEIEENVNKVLVEELGGPAMEDLDVEVRIGDDRSDKEICRYAKEVRADLIVMGTHGLSGIDRALLGSTTERVVRTAPCPVLTFHLKSADES